MNQILTSIFFRWVGSVTNQFLWSSGFRTVFTPKDLNLNPPNLRRQTPAVASFASLPCWGEGKQWPEGDQGPERRETPYEKRCYVWKPSNFESHHFSSNIGGELKVLPFFSDLFAEIAVILVCTLCHGFGTLPWHVGMFLGSCHENINITSSGFPQEPPQWWCEIFRIVTWPSVDVGGLILPLVWPNRSCCASW